MDDKNNEAHSSTTNDFYNTIFTEDTFLKSLSEEEMDEYVEMMILAEELRFNINPRVHTDR